MELSFTKVTTKTWPHSRRLGFFRILLAQICHPLSNKILKMQCHEDNSSVFKEFSTDPTCIMHSHKKLCSLLGDTSTPWSLKINGFPFVFLKCDLTRGGGGLIRDKKSKKAKLPEMCPNFDGTLGETQFHQCSLTPPPPLWAMTPCK